MDHILNTILHGDLDNLDSILDCRDMSNSELRAAMQNLIEHIQRLERQVQTLERAM